MNESMNANIPFNICLIACQSMILLVRLPCLPWHKKMHAFCSITGRYPPLHRVLCMKHALSYWTSSTNHWWVFVCLGIWMSEYQMRAFIDVLITNACISVMLPFSSPSTRRLVDVLCVMQATNQISACTLVCSVYGIKITSSKTTVCVNMDVCMYVCMYACMYLVCMDVCM